MLEHNLKASFSDNLEQPVLDVVEAGGGELGVNQGHTTQKYEE